MGARNEEKLINLLRKKRGFFEAICDLTENESSLPTREWVHILEQKRVLLSCIDEIDCELAEYKEAMVVLSQEMHEELENVKLVVARILHLDNENQEKRKNTLSYERKETL